MQLENLMNINQFDYKYKEMVLQDENLVIDNGIKDLVEAINSINVLCTMNSCQGSLIEDESNYHCPLTYVDFYVLYHQYHIAHKLLSGLINKFGSILNCNIQYEADYDFDENDEDAVIDNGLINLRFRIEIIEASNVIGIEKTYKEMVDYIRKFNEKF